MKVKAKGLDHVAIAVRDLEKSTALYRDVFGLALTEIEDVPSEKVRTAIFGHGLGRIELVSPSSPDSAVAKFLDKRGEGLHHICIEVEDIVAALAELEARGMAIISQPKPGAGGAQIAFVHPKGTGGVLVELRQGPAKHG